MVLRGVSKFFAAPGVRLGYGITGNMPFLKAMKEKQIQLLNNLREQMYRYRIEYLKKKECYPQLIAEHEAIMQAIEGHDKAMATQITGQHINNQVDTVVGTLRSKMPDF